MVKISDTITADSVKINADSTAYKSKNEMHPDSTIFGRRNDTTFLDDKRYGKINEMNMDCYRLAYKMEDRWDDDINKVTKDNVTRVMKHYKNYYHESYLRMVCKTGPFLRNSKKKYSLNHIKECYSERAKELNIDVSDLDKEFEDAMQKAFTGFWVKCLGILKKQNIERLENITNEYLSRIEQKEIEIREGLFHKPFPDEKVKAFLDKTEKRGAYVTGYNPLHKQYMEDLAQDTVLSKGINFTGKVEYPSKQRGGSCVMHASVNALEQNEKGSHLVNRLFRVFKDGSAEAVCIPEAVKNSLYYYPMANTIDIETLAWKCSFGDGDMATLINSYHDYCKQNNKKFARIQRGFEALSGERAQIYFPDEPIPKGVGIVDAYRGDENTLYKNLKTMLDEGNGAAICGLNCNLWGEVNLGNYITDLETETDTGKKAFGSTGHAYSIVKMTDDYVYLQESNEPTLYIKLEKQIFLYRMDDVATWRYK